MRRTALGVSRIKRRSTRIESLCAGFALATGWIVGFVSLAVGYVVGKAVVFGSGGVGGRRYQVAAVLSTYIAVSMAVVPIAISQQMKQKSAQQRAQAGDPTIAAKPKMSPLKAHGVIGLVILFVGIRIAWRLTAGNALSITGPYNDPTAAAPG
ncbi:MAG: hypothetical protein ABI356_00865 [Steroidobacteraceae bacterium]